MAATNKKRTDLSVKEKIDILHRYDTNFSQMSQRNAAVQLKISQPLLCKILKNREVLIKKEKLNENIECKRNRSGKDEKVEKALKLWFSNVREKDAPVTGPLMRQKAEDLAEKMGNSKFIASDGWLQRWRKRENIVFKRFHGEQKDADLSGAEKWIKEEWPKLLSSYSAENIHNADETGLYFRALPQHTFSFQNEAAKGHKICKERVTVLCCVSMTGKKKKLLVVGKSKQPRCFKGVKKLPVDYDANKSAWMTTIIFNEWLRNWDNELKHDILLLVDNCTAHEVNVLLKHINVVFLPPNTTALIQPCDQGIIRTFKAYYRHEMRARILEELEDKECITANELAKKINLLEALHLMVMSWNRISPATIKNCFISAGFCEVEKDDGMTTLQTPESVPDDMTEEDYEAWMVIDRDIPVAAKLTEAEILQTVCEETQNDDEDQEDDGITLNEKPPTNAEMRNALKILRRGVQHRSENFQKQYDYEQFINELLSENCKQAKITEFFQ